MSTLPYHIYIYIFTLCRYIYTSIYIRTLFRYGTIDYHTLSNSNHVYDIKTNSVCKTIVYSPGTYKISKVHPDIDTDVYYPATSYVLVRYIYRLYLFLLDSTKCCPFLPVHAVICTYKNDIYQVSPERSLEVTIDKEQSFDIMINTSILSVRYTRKSARVVIEHVM